MIFEFFRKHWMNVILSMLLAWSIHQGRGRQELITEQNILNKDLLSSLHLAYAKLDTCRYELDVAQSVLWKIHEENGPYRSNDSAGVFYRIPFDTIPPGKPGP